MSYDLLSASNIKRFSNDGDNLVVDLTIVIPCLNEEENIVQILDHVSEAVSGHDFTFEIIVVDDQSDDKTLKYANEWASKNKDKIRTSVITRPLRRRGYGAVVRWGVSFGIGRYCIFVSADDVDPLDLIPKLYNKMEEGAVLAQCSRYLTSGDDSTIPFKYKFFQFFFRIAVRISLGKRIADSTYAFKMFRRSEMLAIGLNQNRFSISPELTFKAILLGGHDGIKYIAGAQGVRTRGVSKFIFYKEGLGFGYCLLRAFLHRFNIIYWF